MGNVICNEYSFLVEWGFPRWVLEKRLGGNIEICSREKPLEKKGL